MLSAGMDVVKKVSGRQRRRRRSSYEPMADGSLRLPPVWGGVYVLFVWEKQNYERY